MKPTSTIDPLTVNSAVVRLTRSRDALRVVLYQTSIKNKNQTSAAPHFSGSMSAAFNTVMSRPSVQLLSKVVQQMWAKNPWRILAQSALEASAIVLKPIAQRSPVKLVASAFFVGGLMFLIRPWRLVSKHTIAASFLRRWL